MIADQVGARLRHQRSQAHDKILGLEDYLRRAVSGRRLLLVNYKVTDVTHGYAGQRSILLETLIAEQARISEALFG